MLLVNYSFLKSKNGMFFYAQDYINLLQDRQLEIDEVPLCNELNFYSKFKCIVFLYYQYIIFSKFIYTPTPHPLPFLRRQLIVVHDSYPFIGFKGRLKKNLLKFGVFISKCNVGYINSSDSFRLAKNICPADRLIYLPNLISTQSTKIDRKLNEEDLNNKNFLDIGLFGTDSDKKNYEHLFRAVRALDDFSYLKFSVLGTQTPYILRLLNKFNDLNIELVSSDGIQVHEFINKLDLIVSVAKNEGFGRLISMALVQKKPVMLVNDEVFIEFFGENAHFFKSVNDLVVHLTPENFNSFKVKDYPPMKLKVDEEAAKKDFLRLCQVKF